MSSLPLRRLARKNVVSDVFENEFAHESLKSDRSASRSSWARSLSRWFDSQLLISERVWQAFDGGLAEAVPMGQVEVRGREQAIQIYQVA